MKNTNMFTLLIVLLFSFGMNAQSLLIDTKPDTTVQEGETFSVDVTVENFSNVISCQFAVFWDPQVLKYVGVNNHGLPEVSSDNLNAMYAEEGRIRFNWVDPDPNFAGFSLADGQSIFSVQFQAIGGPATSTMIDVSGDEVHPILYLEFVNSDSEPLDIELESGRVTIDGVSASKETVTQDFTLFQNNPNPFITETNISFNLKQTTQAQLSIRDHAGKVIYTNTADFTAGLHTIQVNRDLFSSAGSYFFTLKTENATATRQLVVQ